MTQPTPSEPLKVLSKSEAREKPVKYWGTCERVHESAKDVSIAPGWKCTVRYFIKQRRTFVSSKGWVWIDAATARGSNHV